MIIVDFCVIFDASQEITKITIVYKPQRETTICIKIYIYFTFFLLYREKDDRREFL